MAGFGDINILMLPSMMALSMGEAVLCSVLIDLVTIIVRKEIFVRSWRTISFVCTMEHNCLGRVMCVATDKLDHCFKSGRSKELTDLLSKEGDGCVMATGFTEVDVDKPKEN